MEFSHNHKYCIDIDAVNLNLTCGHLINPWNFNEYI